MLGKTEGRRTRGSTGDEMAGWHCGSVWENILVLRKYRPRSSGVKCCVACHFGMIQKIKVCECVGIVREEANATEY